MYQRQYWLSLELINSEPSLHSNRTSLLMQDSLAVTAKGNPLKCLSISHTGVRNSAEGPSPGAEARNSQS